ncbi:hypothetical protein PTSG_00914 [Salpingoeca rosetta]|uniref:Uncharacterized protein n=1 Tax=Salpingoeca rosetta (strain ATCC 50818 / BSB-021) TaxID=946362 RepID=F2TXV1_SALR5|nr:uncharacterized protein PTSG_00914 [Salpingoeca rosetta]EGD76210.1 hypothetical protein PTSG_00914 [Salpingoeca rosetta]|eukprot:XP_004998385.1 hypothetical protein PTSG_00914 [Salpingoeca rosetta]
MKGGRHRRHASSGAEASVNGSSNSIDGAAWTVDANQERRTHSLQGSSHNNNTDSTDSREGGTSSHDDAPSTTGPTAGSTAGTTTKASSPRVPAPPTPSTPPGSRKQEGVACTTPLRGGPLFWTGSENHDTDDEELAALAQTDVLFYPKPQWPSTTRAHTSIDTALRRVCMQDEDGAADALMAEEKADAAVVVDDDDVFAADGDARSPPFSVQRQALRQKRLRTLQAKRRTLSRRHTISGLAEIHAFKSLDRTLALVLSPSRPQAPAPDTSSPIVP